MQRYDLISFHKREKDILVESTDEVALDWITEHHRAPRPEPNHKWRVVSFPGYTDLIFWVLVTHFSHEGWEPLHARYDKGGRIVGVVMCRMVEVPD